jgi:hypothetical protein
VAQNVREAVARIVVEHNGQPISITVSGGVATIQPNERVEMLIQRADAALYAAKAAGRNCAFAHDGVDFRLADGTETAAAGGATARLIELIKSPEAEKPQVNGVEHGAAPYIGSFLPQEAISAKLADACQELRRLLAERGQQVDDRSPTPPHSAAGSAR